MDVLFYTNWPLRPDAAGFRALQGWWSDRGQALRERLPRSPPRSRMHNGSGWTLAETLKFEWAGSSASSSHSDPQLVSDADVVFQCTAAELHRRFPSFRTPIVVGAELNWFPRPATREHGDSLDPFYAGCRRPLRYPNSGGILGTRGGLVKLMQAVRDLPTFPCCSTWDPARECHVLGQACLQAALLTMRLATWPVCAPSADSVCDDPVTAIGDRQRKVLSWRCAAPPGALRRHRRPIAASTHMVTGTNDNESSVGIKRDAYNLADYSLDVLGRLFLNTYYMQPRDVYINSKGQLAFSGYAGFGSARSGEEVVPCVVHTNGFKRLDLFKKLLPRWTAVTWVPANATVLQRELIKHLDRRRELGKRLSTALDVTFT